MHPGIDDKFQILAWYIIVVLPRIFLDWGILDQIILSLAEARWIENRSLEFSVNLMFVCGFKSSTVQSGAF